MKTIYQIEAFVDEVSPQDAIQSDLTTYGPQTISKKSVALFKTSKRRVHDRMLGEFQNIVSEILQKLKELNDVNEKLESGLLFTHNELVAKKKQFETLFDLKSAKSKLKSLYNKEEFKALTATLEESDELVEKTMTNEEVPFQMMIKFRRGRFGLWKRYKKDKHTRVILLCACAIRDVLQVLKDTIENNDECIRSINRIRTTMKTVDKIEHACQTGRKLSVDEKDE